jgi:hypothetical protein
MFRTRSGPISVAKLAARVNSSSQVARVPRNISNSIRHFGADSTALSAGVLVVSAPPLGDEQRQQASNWSSSFSPHFGHIHMASSRRFQRQTGHSKRVPTCCFGLLPPRLRSGGNRSSARSTHFPLWLHCMASVSCDALRSSHSLPHFHLTGRPRLAE